MKLTLYILVMMFSFLIDASHQIHRAIEQNNAIDVRYLIIDNEKNKEAKNEYEDTPLILAAALGRKKIVKILLCSGVNINAVNIYGNSPLHQAAFNEHCFIAILLLQAGADPSLKNIENVSPAEAASEWLLSRVSALQRQSSPVSRMSPVSRIVNNPPVPRMSPVPGIVNNPPVPRISPVPRIDNNESPICSCSCVIQ